MSHKPPDNEPDPGIRPTHRTAFHQCHCQTAERDDVVNRSMSLDGFIAGPGEAMNWIFDFIAPDAFPEIAAATAAMLIGRRTYECARGRGTPTSLAAKNTVVDGPDPCSPSR